MPLRRRCHRRQPDAFGPFSALVTAALMTMLAVLRGSLLAADPVSAAGTNHVASFSRSLTLAGKQVEVDFYLPRGAKEAPAAVVAHGFSRSRHNMAGWGELLAANGFIVAVPDLPARFDDNVNSQGISELFDRLNKGEFMRATKPTGTGALLGHSMGGLCTLIAAATNDPAVTEVVQRRLDQFSSRKTPNKP